MTIEQEPTEMITGLAPLLKDADIAAAREYLEVDEYGLSLDVLSYASHQNNVPVSSKNWERMKELAERMGIPLRLDGPQNNN